MAHGIGAVAYLPMPVKPAQGYLWTFSDGAAAWSPPPSTLSGLTTNRLLAAASATTAATPATIATDQQLTTSNTTASTSVLTGAIVAVGGIGTSGHIWGGSGLSIGPNASATVSGGLIFSRLTADGDAFILFQEQGTSRVQIRSTIGSEKLRLTDGTGATDFATVAFAKFEIKATTAASSSIAGSLVIGDQATAATNVAFGGGKGYFGDTTNSTSITTGSGFFAGGLVAIKNFLAAMGFGGGVANTATAAGTTTITATSTAFQNYTGATTQTEQLPAANLLGANIAVVRFIKNKSSGTVTVQRAGSDTIFLTASVTSFTLTSGQGCILFSDGVSEWSAIRV